MSRLISLLHKINFTYKAEMFSKLPENLNRKVERAHTKTLESSLDAIGSLRVVICSYLHFLDKHKLYIIDGQHLVEASTTKEYEIAYVILDIQTKRQLIKTIAFLNSSSKNWKLHDYVLAWSSLLPDYKIVWRTYMMNNIPLSAVICAYTNLDTRDTKPVKEGQVKIDNTAKAKGDKIIKHLSDIYKIIPRSNRTLTRMVTEQFVQMMYTNSRGYDHELFCEFVAANFKKMAFLPERTNVWQEFLASYK